MDTRTTSMPTNPETARHPGPPPRRVRPMSRTPVTDPRDNLPSVLAQRASPASASASASASDDVYDSPDGPPPNVYAELRGHTWGSHIGVGTCAPGGEALASEMLRQVAACRGPGAGVAIEVHPLGPGGSRPVDGQQLSYPASFEPFPDTFLPFFAEEQISQPQPEPQPPSHALLPDSGAPPPETHRASHSSDTATLRASPRRSPVPYGGVSKTRPRGAATYSLRDSQDLARWTYQHWQQRQQQTTPAAGEEEKTTLLHTEADPLDAETDLPEDETYSSGDDADEEKRDEEEDAQDEPDEDEADEMDEEMDLLREEGEWWEDQKAALQAEVGSWGPAVYWNVEGEQQRERMEGQVQSVFE